MHAFLRVTNTCHCLVSDGDLPQHTTYRTSLSLGLSYQSYPKAARLASLLPQSPIHTSPRIRGIADSQAADHVSCAATPTRKRDTRLAAAGFRPPLLRYTCVSSMTTGFRQALSEELWLIFSCGDRCLSFMVKLELLT